MKTKHHYGEKTDRALELWVKLARASATFMKLSVDNIRGFGLTEPQFGVLEILGHLGPLTLGGLSKKRLVSGGNMTCVVDHLEKAGYVERVPSTEDRRAIHVRLTPTGQKLFNAVFRKHAGYITSLVSVLRTDEQEILSRLLKKLGCSLGQMYSLPRPS
jgi:MarR family 2-MHQ and catechol resistance regulon transcriptional repressor